MVERALEATGGPRAWARGQLGVTGVRLRSRTMRDIALFCLDTVMAFRAFRRVRAWLVAPAAVARS